MAHRSTPFDTIAALATPPGAGAIAVVRLSGDDAIAVGDRVFRGKRPLSGFGGFEGAHGRIVDHAGRAVDEVVAWIYRAPRTYTGEDLVEFSCHGGAVPAERVLDALRAAGARPAAPGEFTRRAFLNGRIDLAQAEAVADLIAARGRRAQEHALARLEGALSRRIRAAADRVREVLARITAFLDFEEDVPGIPDKEELIGALEPAGEDLRRLAAGHAAGRRARDGVTIALVGRPNVGKSSLLNALAGFERAIVHDAPGTTRDVVDVVVEWDGIPVRLVDTAGLREEAGPVEAVGMELARREQRAADRVVWVVDASVGLTPEDAAVARQMEWERTHLVINKIDLVGPPEGWVNLNSLKRVHLASAAMGMGVSELRQGLLRALGLDEDPERESPAVAGERQAASLEAAAAAVERAIGALRAGQPAELVAADLHRALDALAEITGERAGPELLDAIFSRFCIGK